MALDRGTLIALEGIDGAGKGTQASFLVARLEERGIVSLLISFPRYATFSGKLVGRYLSGEFGALFAVSPYLTALPYALDRFEARREILEALDRGTIVVADRYVGSNVAHQAAKLPQSERAHFTSWVLELEYEVLGLPREQLTIWLDMPVSAATTLVDSKGRRSYTSAQRDLHEVEGEYLNGVAMEFARLADERSDWEVVRCVDEGGQLRDRSAIGSDVLALAMGKLGYRS